MSERAQGLSRKRFRAPQRECARPSRVAARRAVRLVVAHVEVEVPSRGPADGRLLPRHVVSEDVLARAVHRLRWQLRAQRHARQLGILPPLAAVRVLHLLAQE
eukprot:6212837-Pleurochrysis_carterae.AAC.2